MSKPLDRAVVEGLYRRYWFQVEARCRRILSGPEAADAAQEVFVRLITSGGDFRGDAEWMTWLYRVATNVCLNHIRDRGRRDAEWEAAARDATLRPSSNPEADLCDRDTLIRLLRRFDRKTQQIAIHYFVDEMSQEEIGALTALSRVSVNKRLMKFRNAVQQELKTRGP